jgi:signal peptidase I
MSSQHHHDVQHGSTVVDTIQSLIVAFVLAMTFRSFVTEGFVIPTGSMAPTLLGQHFLVHSDETGAVVPAGVGNRPESVYDPMLGPDYETTTYQALGLSQKRRMGDRVLVIKSLYPFNEPDRFDVVVFKNPTDPKGDAGNYIKRLIGLPNEKIWLADGDVFAGDVNTPGLDGYQVKRKPEHIQRAVWQPVYHSDFYPIDTSRLSRRFQGPFWAGEGWETRQTNVYTCDTAAPTTLQWNTNARPITDWNPYNIFSVSTTAQNTSDLRVAAGLVADDPAALTTTFRLEAREHFFEFIIDKGRATVRMKPIRDADAPWTESEPVTISLPDPGAPMNVDFWHVDQALAMYINNTRVCYLEYDWSPADRVQCATGQFLDAPDVDRLSRLCRTEATPAYLSWEFAGSPVQLHRVRIDRDLFYRYTTVSTGARAMNAIPDGYEDAFLDLVAIGTDGYGTTPAKPARLNGNHFLMLGDNSEASSDSRVWGNVHPLVAAQIDSHPFVVPRRLLLGKAWVVYFPAPYSMGDGGRSFIPDFGRLRFIR